MIRNVTVVCVCVLWVYGACIVCVNSYVLWIRTCACTSHVNLVLATCTLSILGAVGVRYGYAGLCVSCRVEVFDEYVAVTRLLRVV